MSDFAWLIEAPGGHYLAVREMATRHEFYWTREAILATRFLSAAQADAVMMAVRPLHPDLFGFAVTLGEARPVEHGWLSDAALGADAS